MILILNPFVRVHLVKIRPFLLPFGEHEGFKVCIFLSNVANSFKNMAFNSILMIFY